jgi:hypothetical protein
MNILQKLWGLVSPRSDEQLVNRYRTFLRVRKSMTVSVFMLAGVQLFLDWKLGQWMIHERS